MDSRADIQITKLDNTHIKVDADESIKREMSDYFTFPVPGAKFMPSVRNKYWDVILDYMHKLLVSCILVYIMH